MFCVFVRSTFILQFIVDLQARIYEGNEPIQFFSIFQSFIVFKV